MKRVPIGPGGAFIVGLLGLVAACAAPPPESERTAQSIVITKHAPKVDFGEFKTYFLRPEIRTLDDDGSVTNVDEATATALLNATANNLENRGFEAVGKEEADLAVEMLYIEHVTTTYWCYSWWDYYYWGYPGYPYYPYYGSCDAAVWKSGLLSTIITDVTEARDNPDAGEGSGEGGAGGGSDGPGRNVPGIWFSGVYGVSLSSTEARDGINQAFEQSPYVKAGK